MPRPRSEDRRNAILSAAIRVVASEGLGAATAAIAKEAGVSNGSLFLYFETKATLLNELYIALKTEMGETAVDLPGAARSREQVRHMWEVGLRWATTNPEKRRALLLSLKQWMTPADSHRSCVRLEGKRPSCLSEAAQAARCSMCRSRSSYPHRRDRRTHRWTP